MKTFTNITSCVLSVNDFDIFNENNFEEGGLIFQKNNEFTFAQIDNKNRNTDIGCVLYEPTKEDYIKTVLALNKEGWKIHSSFHTHPKFSAHYSQIDYKFLFQSFPINFIKSIKDKNIMKYAWISEYELVGEEIE